MVNFHKVFIKEIQRPTEESVCLHFDISEDSRSEFQFKPGQHLTLRAFINGEDVRRSYSICSSPDEEDIAVAIKRVDGGKFSEFACANLKIGDEIELLPPTGHFHPASKTEGKLLVCFAAGSGITPIISIIKTVLKNDDSSQIILFYGNQRVHSIIFREELSDLKNIFPDRFSMHHVLSKERQEADLFNGRITAEKIEKFSQLYFDHEDVEAFFVCGPVEMILDTQDTLKRLGVSLDKIKTELFTSPLGKLGGSKKISHTIAQSEIRIVQDGSKIQFPYNSDKSILDAAYDHGADLPYACKGGVCSTCVAKLIKGEVQMDVNYALEEDELEKGLILTCQSYPKSAEVELTFDV